MENNKQRQSRICIVTTRNIFDAPCLAKYQSVLSEPFDIIYWDRCGIDEACGAQHYFKYLKVLRPNSGKASKIGAYAGFKRFADKIMKTHTYDVLVFFPTQTAWLIGRKLRTKYKNRYILDIRDYTGENHRLLNRLTQSAVMNAGLCSITSPAYRHFLPEREYVISHNVQPIDDAIIQEYRARRHTPGAPISLSFIGSVRFIDQQKKLLTAFKNDARFHLNFIGKGSERLSAFCQEQNIQNVTLVGRFEREQLPEFYMNTDGAINVYGNRDPFLDYALSNKLYSAAMMGMPVLVSPETYMAEITDKYGFGCCVDMDDAAAPDKVFAYFQALDRDALFSGCDAFMSSVLSDEKTYIQSVQAYIEEFAKK